MELAPPSDENKARAYRASLLDVMARRLNDLAPESGFKIGLVTETRLDSDSFVILASGDQVGSGRVVTKTLRYPHSARIIVASRFLKSPRSFKLVDSAAYAIAVHMRPLTILERRQIRASAATEDVRRSLDKALAARDQLGLSTADRHAMLAALALVKLPPGRVANLVADWKRLRAQVIQLRAEEQSIQRTIISTIETA